MAGEESLPLPALGYAGGGGSPVPLSLAMDVTRGWGLSQHDGCGTGARVVGRRAALAQP